MLWKYPNQSKSHLQIKHLPTRTEIWKFSSIISIRWVVLLGFGIVGHLLLYFRTSYTSLVKEYEHSSLEQFPAGKTKSSDHMALASYTISIARLEIKVKLNDLLRNPHHQKFIRNSDHQIYLTKYSNFLLHSWFKQPSFFNGVNAIQSLAIKRISKQALIYF